MRVLKSILAGLVALVVALCLVAGVVVGSVIAAQWSSANQGSGGIGAVSVGFSDLAVPVVVLVAVLIFAAGFRWRFKKG